MLTCADVCRHKTLKREHEAFRAASEQAIAKAHLVYIYIHTYIYICIYIYMQCLEEILTQRDLELTHQELR